MITYRRHFQIWLLFFLVFWVSLSAEAASHKPMDFLKRIQGRPDEGPQIVAHYCMMCHAPNPQVQVGAPRMGYPDDWALRLKQGMDVLFSHTLEGLGAMPPRGGCFECRDSQLKKAMKALLPQENKPTKKSPSKK